MCRGVVVTVVDDGLERDNKELQANYDGRASYDYNGKRVFLWSLAVRPCSLLVRLYRVFVSLVCHVPSALCC